MLTTALTFAVRAWMGLGDCVEASRIVGPDCGWVTAELLEGDGTVVAEDSGKLDLDFNKVFNTKELFHLLVCNSQVGKPLPLRNFAQFHH